MEDMILLTSRVETGSRPCRDTESESRSGNADGKLDEIELREDFRAQILSEKYTAKSLHVMLLGTGLSLFVCSMSRTADQRSRLFEDLARRFDTDRRGFH